MKKFLLFVGLIAGLLLANYALRAYQIAQLRKQVLTTLSDSDSAKFQNEIFLVNSSIKTVALCGEVNAKNKMGGYVGYVKFFADENSAVLDDGDLKLVAKIYCKSNPYRSDLSPRWWVLRF